MGADDLQDFRISSLETTVSEVKDAVKSIDQSLKTLASLEVRHSETRDALARAFTKMQDHEDRLRVIEVEMPTIKLIRNWVAAGVISCVGMVGAAVIHLLLK
jgi:hypothetical protein